MTRQFIKDYRHARAPLYQKHVITRLTGPSLSTLYRLEQDGTFPRRRLLGWNTIGWLADEEVQVWYRA
jgi:predicted DNA-binding transcriptional regulator AlpA